jgi:hypothetical protein
MAGSANHSLSSFSYSFARIGLGHMGWSGRKIKRKRKEND